MLDTFFYCNTIIISCNADNTCCYKILNIKSKLKHMHTHKKKHVKLRSIILCTKIITFYFFQIYFNNFFNISLNNYSTFYL